MRQKSRDESLKTRFILTQSAGAHKQCTRLTHLELFQNSCLNTLGRTILLSPAIVTIFLYGFNGYKKCYNKYKLCACIPCVMFGMEGPE